MKSFLDIIILLTLVVKIKGQNNDSPRPPIPVLDLEYDAYKTRFSEFKKPISASGIINSMEIE